MNISGFRPMNRRRIPHHWGLLGSGLILGWLCFPGGGWCESPPSPKPDARVSPPAAAQALPAQDAPIPPGTANPSQKAAETEWLPLREIIQQYSKELGSQIRFKDDEAFDQLYWVHDPSWLEEFSRIELFNEQTGTKEIILLGTPKGQLPAKSSKKTRMARRPSRTNLSTQNAPQQNQKQTGKKRKIRRSIFRR